MKRKFIAVLLAVSLVTTSLALNPMIKAYADENGVNVTTTVQNVGDELYGFRVIKTQYNESTKSNEILLEHVKSGAKMLVVKNKELDRGFSIGFNTPAENDKGINHILEHSLLGGSEKYPTNNMIFNVMNSTYTSFINAMTAQNSTIFPVCSQNEDQLMKLTDIYMDAVYNPLIAKDKKVFEREAWRYELEDENSPLTVNGVVYNEMRGNMGNIRRVENENDKKSIFPDTNQRYCSGGVPSSILDLSYEEFLNTYKRNYVPSNSCMVLYGDVDYAKFLKMIDENYLSKYDKKEVEVDRQEQSAFSGLVQKDYDFPVAKDADTKNKSKIDIVYGMPDIKEIPQDDLGGLMIIAALLREDSLSFNTDLRNSNLAENYSVSMALQTYQPMFTIKADNGDSSKKMEFYNLVNDELKKLVHDGIDKEYVKSALSSAKFNDLNDSEEGSSSVIANMCSLNNIFGDPTINTNDFTKNIEGKLDSNYLESLIDKYFINNTQVALVTTNPKAGLLEENDAKLKQELDDKKNSMSAEEKDALIKETKEFKEWNSKETDQSVIDSLKAVTSKDIKTEVKDYNIKEQATTDAAVKVITADADVKDAASIGLYFDESHLSKEELLYLEFYTDLIDNNLPTEKYTESSLVNTKNSKTNGYSNYLSVFNDDKDGNSVHPVYGLNYITMNEDFNDTLDLSKDILLNTKLDGDLKDYVQRTINNKKSYYASYFSNPSGLGQIMASSHDDLSARYSNYLRGLDYYHFILDLEKNYASNPQEVMNKVKEVRDKAFNKNNLTVLFAGNTASQNKFKDTITLFTSALSDKTYEKATYDLPVPSKRVALTTDTDVQYLAFNSSLANAGIKNEGKYSVLSTILDEKVLIPELRLKGGAYGAGTSIFNNSYCASTFRDNDFVNSLNVISNTQDYLNEVMPSINENTLDNYIISTYANNNSPEPELTGAEGSLYEYANKTTTQDIKQKLEEIKNTNVDDIKNDPEILKKLNENANYVVVCSPEYAEQHKDMFDEIIPLK